ncbi:MAG: type II toxin-antitoxin system PemK/MazF family toxin [Actinoallomurus sp.]
MLRALRDALRTALRPRTTTSPRPSRARGYAGDAPDVPQLTYAPVDDDRPDPGEIVWAWVPFEEDHSQGKDRPVLVIGRRRGLLLALMLTSKDHERDEGRYGHFWVDIGTGAWDRQRRPSEVRVDRVLQLDPAVVRREGAALDRERFDRVAAAVHAVHPRR